MTTATRAYWWLFVKRASDMDDVEALAISDDKLTDTQRAQLENSGWELVLDSAASHQEALARAGSGELVWSGTEQGVPLFAFERPCSACGLFVDDVILVRGMREKNDRVMPWYGYACESCRQDMWDVRATRVMRPGRASHRRHR